MKIHSQVPLFDISMSGLSQNDPDYIQKELSSIRELQNQVALRMKELLIFVQKDFSEETKFMIAHPKEYYRYIEFNNQTIMAKGLTSEAIETLKYSTVEGMVVKLPEGQLDRNIYIEVKNKLELIGGKWKGGKVMGFVFNEDPSELLVQIASGENRNLKKEFQFFGTPDSLADRLVKYAEIKPNDRVCEPSAGQGAIVKAIQRATVPNRIVEGFELMPLNQTFLKKIGGFRLLGSDFLTDCGIHFEKIIANPPFSKNQDIDHIRKMHDSLNSGGRLVSVSSVHWQNATNKKETEFRAWLQEVNAKVIPVEAGAFKESGTTIPTAIVVIDKF